MPFYKPSEVNEAFFKRLSEIVIEGKPVTVRYAKKSADDYTEEQDNQKYPCVAVYDFAPVPADDWFIDMQTYDGGISSNNVDSVIFYRPLHFAFKYDVSIASKKYSDFVALKDYFAEHFLAQVRFLFNPELNGDVGDVVPFDIIVTDIPRRDGVMEANYEFTLFAWVNPRTPIEVEGVTKINITGEPKNLI